MLKAFVFINEFNFILNLQLYLDVKMQNKVNLLPEAYSLKSPNLAGVKSKENQLIIF